MSFKTLHIQGAHVKKEYDYKYESFDDLLKLPKSQCIISLVKGHKWKHSDVTDYPRNDLGLWRSGGLVQWAERTCGSLHPVSGTVCRIALANDEVLWQWRTGSVLVYRFESLKEARDFYKLLFGEDVAIFIKQDDGIIVGDKVKFKRDVVVTNPIASWSSIFGYLSSDVWNFYKDYVVRVADVSRDGKSFVATGVDGYDLIKIPRSGGAKMLKSYGWIPVEYIEKKRKMQ